MKRIRGVYALTNIKKNNEDITFFPYSGLPVVSYFCTQCGELKLEVDREKEHATKYWESCEGCPEGHNSFHKTIVESPEWEAWEKEQKEMFGRKEFDGCFDVNECKECGWISKEHWKKFVEFIKRKI